MTVSFVFNNLTSKTVFQQKGEVKKLTMLPLPEAEGSILAAVGVR
jgi:hypothetical protein